MRYTLTHLKELEAESIYVIREVFAPLSQSRDSLQRGQRLNRIDPFGSKSLLARPDPLSLIAR
jgi:hypothetical protein